MKNNNIVFFKFYRKKLNVIGNIISFNVLYSWLAETRQRFYFKDTKNNK